MNDLVSIVIPAYNAANYLAEAIDSALAQTYPYYEIIVVNDGSPDGGATRAVAQSYGDKIRYFEKENGGCASALNFGIKVMKGKWFSWLSHDDLYLPEKLEKLIALIDKYHLDADEVVLGCNDLIMGPDRKVKHSLFNNSTGILSPVQAFGETLNVKTINGCGLLIPKTILDKVGGFKTEYKHLLDRELWMRIALMGYSYCYAENAYVISRVHSQQITVKAQNLLFSEETTLIREYAHQIEQRSDNIKFLIELCDFAYKRLHYQDGNDIRKKLKQMKALNWKDDVVIAKYAIEGIAKYCVRNIYKTAIRR